MRAGGDPARRWGRLLTIVALAAIAMLTLMPDPGAAVEAALTPVYCLVCGDRGGVDVFLNVLLFVPLGIGLRLASGSWRTAVRTSAALSLGIELLQLTVIEGRDASLSDVLTNTAGGALGAFLATRAGALCRPTPALSRRLYRWGVLACLGLPAASSWLQQPAFEERPMLSTWARPGQPRDFTGRVLGVRVNGRPAPRDGVPEDSARFRRALHDRQLGIELEAISGRPIGARRRMYAVGTGGEARLFLSQEGRRAVLGVPARAARLRLSPPMVVLPDGLPPDSGVRFELRGEASRHLLLLSSRWDGVVRRARARLTPGRGWTLLAPAFLLPGPGERLVTTAVMGLLLLAPAYWGTIAGRAGLRLLGLGAAAGASLWVIPRLAGYAPARWWEWAGVLAGAAGGWVLARAAAYLEPRCGSPSTGEFSSS